MSDWLIALILGAVEGFTEFLPVSSTGHLILVGSILGFDGARATTFEVVIQLGAILAVVWLYRWRLWSLIHPGPAASTFSGARGCGLLALTTTPALLFGAILHPFITASLFGPLTVAIGLASGGVALLWVERRSPPEIEDSLDSLTWRDALIIGLVQCFALWPGVSRATTTIVGGMTRGHSRTTAAEYSFLAAIPLITAAACFELISSLDDLTRADVPLFVVGFTMAFIVARLTIRAFLGYLAHATLRPFGWYRIALAVVVLILLLAT